MAGTGNTVVSTDAQQLPDFGSQFVGRAFQREVTLANMGRVAVAMQWQNLEGEERKKGYARMTRGLGGSCMAASSHAPRFEAHS
jgi:hypothetical protein